MCLGVPGQILEAPDEAGMASVAVGGRQRQVNCLLLLDDGAVDVGQWVLIHMGLALERLDEADAREVLAQLDDPTSGLPERNGGTR